MIPSGIRAGKDGEHSHFGCTTVVLLVMSRNCLFQLDDLVISRNDPGGGNDIAGLAPDKNRKQQKEKKHFSHGLLVLVFKESNLKVGKKRLQKGWNGRALRYSLLHAFPKILLYAES
jgi:hypothetical protein